MAAMLMGAGLASTGFAQESQSSSWLDQARLKLTNTLGHLEKATNEGRWEGYLPLHTHHMRYAYDKEKINSYNENPFGLGIGRGIFTSDGDWYGVYVLEFSDSHFKPEYQVGFGYKTYWPLTQEIKVGLGYTAFIGARSDIGHYSPFPAALPVFSLEYKKIALDSAFVPGGKGFGNVLFTWAKHSF